jgi:two-component system, NarL family, nitrate/nitrite response regulator NarL
MRVPEPEIIAFVPRTNRVRVVLADDHPIYREGLARAIKERPELQLAGEAKDGREALELIQRDQPDVAVLDVRMPDLEGPQVLHAINRDRIPIAVVFLSAHLDGDTAYRVVAEGASAFLSKHADRAEICEAIARVARGEIVLAPEVQAGLAREIAARGVDAQGPDLTSREAEVLRLIADGLSTPEIARRIHLSPPTVKGHLQSLYEKLGVSDRAAAVAEAMRRGLLE